MRPVRRFSNLPLAMALVLIAVGCSGPASDKASADQPAPAPSLLLIDTSALGAKFSVVGSAASGQAVGMGIRFGSGESIACLRSDGSVPSLQVLPNGLAARASAGSSHLVGTGGPSPSFWLTAQASDGGQLLGVVDASGTLSTVVATTRGGSEPVAMSESSAITMGRVAADGSFLTPRVTTTEAGSVDLGMHSFDTSMRESSTHLAGNIVRGGGEGTALDQVGDFDLGANGQVLCAYGQSGLVVVNPGGTSTLVPYLQTPTMPVTHVVTGRTANEALVLAGAQVLVVRTDTGEARAISLGSRPFVSGGPYVRRLFREGSTGVVVGDAKILRFDLGSGTLLPEVSFSYGPVVAAEQSNGKLFLAHSGTTGDSLSWLPLR